MKKIVFYLLLVFLGTIALVAQPEPCKPDCFDSEWIPAYPAPPSVLIITLPECNNASVIVKYRYRFACPGVPLPCTRAESGYYQDYFIEGIEWPINQPGFENCLNSLGISGFINNETKAFMRQNQIVPFFPKPCNPTNCPIQNGQQYHFHNDPFECCDQWRVMKGSCWKADMFKKLLEPCNYSNCCLEKFTVCVTADGFDLEVNSGGIYNYGLCVDPDPSCIPVCGTLLRQ